MINNLNNQSRETLKKGYVWARKPDSEYAVIYQLGETTVRKDTSMAAKTPEDRERVTKRIRRALWDILENQAIQRIIDSEAEILSPKGWTADLRQRETR